jgi:hypothetical protein
LDGVDSSMVDVKKEGRSVRTSAGGEVEGCGQHIYTPCGVPHYSPPASGGFNFEILWRVNSKLLCEWTVGCVVPQTCFSLFTVGVGDAEIREV